MKTILNYYIVDRKTGTSYTPIKITFFCNIIAVSNKATEQGRYLINTSRLLRGLAERRYRLTPKTI